MAVVGLLVGLALKAGFAMRNSQPLTGLASFLHRDALLDFETARHALQKAREQNISFTQYVVNHGILTSESIFSYCANNFDLPLFKRSQFDEKALPQKWVHPELIHRYHVFPLYKDQHFLYIAVSDPTDQAGLSAIGFHTGLRTRAILINETELDKLIKNYCKQHIFYSHLETTLSKIAVEEYSASEEKEPENAEPIIKFVDQLIIDACNKTASDIHIEPYEQHSRIRFRCNGLLQQIAMIPPHLALRAAARIKVMANLNITERRLPQDGRILFQHENKINIRVNTCPTLFGEKIVLRLLDSQQIQLDLDTLNLSPLQQKTFLQKLNQPQGLILVTGPTGSGKTTTLYTALNYLNMVEKNISSAEDPVEIQLPNINQVSINPKIGLDFAEILRTFLRQDPDVIMIGEIRDKETATIAIQAACTGHLVLSTLHTNNAIEAIMRLQAMGLSTYTLVQSLTLLIAQRLIRKLCEHCKQPDKLLINGVEYNVFSAAAGCEHCCQGYGGRIAIFELIAMNETLKQALLAKSNGATLFNLLKTNHVMNLWESGLEKVLAGMSSYQELIRVLGEKEDNHETNHSD